MSMDRRTMLTAMVGACAAAGAIGAAATSANAVPRAMPPAPTPQSAAGAADAVVEGEAKVYQAQWWRWRRRRFFVRPWRFRRRRRVYFY